MICSSCGNGFCIEDGRESCPFCKRATLRANVERGLWDGIEVTWILYDSRRVGLLGFVHIPIEILIAFNTLKETPPDVILFPSKAESNAFTNSFMKAAGIEGEPADAPETSRYGIIHSANSGSKVLTVNLGATKGRMLGFVLRFGQRLLQNETIMADEATNGLKLLYADIMQAYLAKLGLPFANPMENDEHNLRLFVSALASNWYEYASLKETTRSENESYAADFISEKIDIQYHRINFSRIWELEVVLEIAGRFINNLAVLAAVRNVPVLTKVATQKVAEVRKMLAQQLSANGDVLRGLDLIFNNLSTADFDSFDRYLLAARSAFLGYVGQLEPSYVRLNEALKLLEIALEYT